MDPRTYMRVQTIKQARRKLIDALRLVYPMYLTFDSLAIVLPTFDVEHIQADVSYLIDKGYLKCINERKHQPWGEREYRLTATGKEIADAINVDPALEP